MGAPGTPGKLVACEPAPPSIDGAEVVGLQVTQESLVPPVRKVPGGVHLGLAQPWGSQSLWSLTHCDDFQALSGREGEGMAASGLAGDALEPLESSG